MPGTDIDHLLIPGVPPLKFGAGEENTFIGSFRRVLACMGRQTSYAWLMGISGAAFRLQIHCNGWHAVATDLISGFDLTATLYEACGVSCDRLWICGNRLKMAGANARIAANIRSGIPSLGLGMDGRSWHGVVIGASSGTCLTALDYSIPSSSHEVLEKLVWCYHVVHSQGAPLPPASQVCHTFSIARTLMTTNRVHSFHLGLDAYDYWCATLTNPDHHDAQSNDWRARERNDGNYWLLVTLIDARKSAATFCRDAVVLMPDMARDLRALASLYDAIADTLQPLLDKRTVRPARQISKSWPWTMHDRRKQALFLSTCKGLEQEALEVIAG